MVRGVYPPLSSGSQPPPPPDGPQGIMAWYIHYVYHK